jgi:trehalose monomycolate/heme transporter
MFASLGRLAARRRWSVLTAGVVFLVVSALWGTTVFSALTSDGFGDPDSESLRATEALEATVGNGRADVLVLYRSTDGRTVDDPSYRDDVARHLSALPADAVESEVTWWGARAPQLVSEDRRSTYAALQLAGSDAEASYERIADALAVPPTGLEVLRGGDLVLNEDINTQVSEDIARAESLSLPIVMVLLVVIFGGVVAAGLPLLIGVLAILGAFTALKVLTLVTDVSVFSINIVTMLGLGLAIDYALFIVSRFREELALVGGRAADRSGVETALVRTMSTAGRTVAISGLTVAISLASLLLFPQVFLRSMGFGGIAAVVVAMVGALTVLPALLAALGPRVDALRIPFLARRARRDASAANDTDGAWARIARGVMRRPIPVVVVIVAALLALGAPFLHFTPGGIDYRVLPEGTESREVSEALDRDFPGATEPLTIAVDTADEAALAAYVDALSAVPGVTSSAVDAVGQDAARVTVGHAYDPQSEAARGLVDAVRDVPAPPETQPLVGGPTAELTDLLDSIGAVFPWMAAFIALVTLIILFLAFGSVVLPIKALAMNVLSLTATFGVVVWGFQDGNLAGVLGFTGTGTVEATQPILMLAIAFGLSMDYEVFLLSRVREQWDLTHDNTLAVATGLQRTGSIITSAALLLVIVIGSFATSGITFIAMIGVGMAIAIIVDATIVRVLLVPATMRLLGDWNWWAPGPLARIYDRYGLREGDDLAASSTPDDLRDLPELTRQG